MTSAAEEVINTSLSHNVDLRTAAYLNAINRLHDFFDMTGIHWNDKNFIKWINVINRSKRNILNLWINKG